MINENRTLVIKGWGYEDWIWNDAKYCGKKLFFIRRRRLSWHYHAKKEETFYLQSGKLLLFYSFDDCLDHSGRKLVARAEAPFPGLSDASWLTTSGDRGASHVVLEAGDSFHVVPGLRHLMYGLCDSEMFEFSTQHFDDDSIRVLKGD